MIFGGPRGSRPLDLMVEFRLHLNMVLEEKVVVWINYSL